MAGTRRLPLLMMIEWHPALDAIAQDCGMQKISRVFLCAFCVSAVKKSCPPAGLPPVRHKRPVD
jgi:hypothetical protein